MNVPARLIARISQWSANGLSVLLGASLITMFVCVGVQVIARSLFASSVLWLEDLLMSCFTVSIFTGIALAFRSHAHLATTVLSDSLPEGAALILRRLIDLTCVLAMAALGWVGIDFAANAFGQFTPVLRLPLGWVYLIIPVTAALSILFILENQLSVRDLEQ